MASEAMIQIQSNGHIVYTADGGLPGVALDTV